MQKLRAIFVPGIALILATGCAHASRTPQAEAAATADAANPQIAIASATDFRDLAAAVRAGLNALNRDGLKLDSLYCNSIQGERECFALLDGASAKFGGDAADKAFRTLGRLSKVYYPMLNKDGKPIPKARMTGLQAIVLGGQAEPLPPPLD